MLLPESAEDDATALPRGRNPPDLAAEEVGSGPAAAVCCPRYNHPLSALPDDAGLKATASLGARTPRHPPRAVLRQLVLRNGTISLPGHAAGTGNVPLWGPGCLYLVLLWLLWDLGSSVVHGSG